MDFIFCYNKSGYRFLSHVCDHADSPRKIIKTNPVTGKKKIHRSFCSVINKDCNCKSWEHGENKLDRYENERRRVVDNIDDLSDDVAF